jgi:hypothetical protein
MREGCGPATAGPLVTNEAGWETATERVRVRVRRGDPRNLRLKKSPGLSCWRFRGKNPRNSCSMMSPEEAAGNRDESKRAR